MAEIKARAPGDGDSPYIYPDPVDPNLSNIGTEVKIFRLNPDGSKGELLRTGPAFPDGWENPRFNVSPKKRKEVDEVAAKPRKDRAEITRKVRALMEEGMTLKKAAEEAGVPVTTVYTWLEQDKKTPKKRQAEKSAEPEQGQPVPPRGGTGAVTPSHRKEDPQPDWTEADEEPIQYWPEEDPKDELKVRLIAEVLKSRLSCADQLGMIEGIIVTM
jgi:hypothetical protein